MYAISYFIFRYTSFFPYDHNRVCLEKLIEEDDFINASWINEENNGLNKNLLIACQGPLPNTIVHFLQMIVEQKVEVIVMLCLPFEKKRFDRERQLAENGGIEQTYGILGKY